MSVSIRDKTTGEWVQVAGGIPANSAPVDVVENGNMKAVTSNAVAELLEVQQATATFDTSKFNPNSNILLKSGKVVTIRFGGIFIATISKDANTPTTIGTIPEGFRPRNGAILHESQHVWGVGVNANVGITIDSSGNIKAFSYDDVTISTGYLWPTLTYIAEN